MNKLDDDFFNRADAHIQLSNDQMANVSIGKVSASMLYSVARFNAYVIARECNSMEQMKEAQQEAIQFFVGEYEKMLKENLDDYLKNFNGYMRQASEDFSVYNENIYAMRVSVDMKTAKLRVQRSEYKLIRN